MTQGKTKKQTTTPATEPIIGVNARRVLMEDLVKVLQNREQVKANIRLIVEAHQKAVAALQVHEEKVMSILIRLGGADAGV